MSAIGSSIGGYPACKFEPGTDHWGTITGIKDAQVTDFKTREPQSYPDGNPILQTILTIEKSDGELYRMFVKPGNMRNAAVEALNAVSADDVEIGGQIKMACLGKEPAKNGGERYTYRAWYKKPAAGVRQPQTVLQPPPDDDIPDSAYADDEPPF